MSVAAQRVIAPLRVRNAPTLAAARVSGLAVGATLFPEAEVVGQEVSGTSTWFRLGEGQFVWAGGCVPLQNGAAPAVAGGMDVTRRPDGSIRSLSIAEVKQVFGTFAYTEGAKGDINIDSVWASRNTLRLAMPLLARVGYERITVHKKAAGPFSRVFAAIEAAGLADNIRGCGGVFYPRHMGHDPTRELSTHSWGIAIDLNVAWNPYHTTPAPLGAIGSVRELVPLFEAEGFAWGGYFAPPLTDGMHFELARRDA